MKYLAVTQKTAEWFINTPLARFALLDELVKLATSKSLAEGALSVGSLRIAADKSDVLAIWNTDYTTATGIEEWGFILLETEDGILAHHEILPEVFERCLFIINQRLQGLLLPADGQYIHRSLGNNIHCCLAGRGAMARKSYIGYIEGVYTYKYNNVKSLLTVGPWSGKAVADVQDALKRLVEQESVHIQDLVNASNRIINTYATRPAIDSSVFIGLRQHFQPKSVTRGLVEGDLPVIEIPEMDLIKVAQEKVYETLKWPYEKWVESDSPLSPLQRSIFEQDIILKQPLRLIGAAGSGKTLLMQLLCIKRLKDAKSKHQSIRVLYVVHNNEMADTMYNRFTTLGASEYLDEASQQHLLISTLFGYSQSRLGLSDISIIDKDAYQTKLFQRALIKQCVKQVAKQQPEVVKGSPFLTNLTVSIETQDVYADLIGTEIGIAIKGRDLGNDKKKYVESEKALSRLHGTLKQQERAFVYDIFHDYHTQLFEEYETLDADDVAISLLGHFRTPLWEMRRKAEGFDYVFVDETQLFNENERCLFHFLTKEDKDHLPIALALDEAQSIHGATTSGFGALGIENISNQMLESVHRSTRSILELAFFLLQRTTDLFTSEFPDFTSKTITLVGDDHPLSSKPCIVVPETQTLSKGILKEVRALRKRNIRQIGIVIHSDKYWDEIVNYFENTETQLPIMIQSKRGERIDPNSPIVVITRPETVGGQEFDAVLAVGIEKGLVPPLVKGHSGLQTALEQQVLREMYLSFTRSRYCLTIVNSPKSQISPILQSAVDAGLIKMDTIN